MRNTNRETTTIVTAAYLSAACQSDSVALTLVGRGWLWIWSKVFRYQSVGYDRYQARFDLTPQNSVFPSVADSEDRRAIVTHPVLLTQIAASTFRNAPANSLLVRIPTASPNPNRE